MPIGLRGPDNLADLMDLGRELVKEHRATLSVAGVSAVALAAVVALLAARDFPESPISPLKSDTPDMVAPLEGSGDEGLMGGESAVDHSRPQEDGGHGEIGEEGGVDTGVFGDACRDVCDLSGD